MVNLAYSGLCYLWYEELKLPCNCIMWLWYIMEAGNLVEKKTTVKFGKIQSNSFGKASKSLNKVAVKLAIICGSSHHVFLDGSASGDSILSR